MKKRYLIPLIIILMLVAVRLALPYWVEDYVNETLRDISGYTGSVENINIQLYRGAYRIDGMVIDKIEGNHRVPFLEIDQIDLSVEWPALLKGSLAGEVHIEAPVLNFVAPEADEGQYGEDVNWTEPLKELIPIEINRFTLSNGTIHFLDFSTSPQVDLSLRLVELEILNISNVEPPEDETLPSSIRLQAISIGNGVMNIIARANLLKDIPDMELVFEFEDVYLPDLNDFLEAYASVDAEDGMFHLYSEITMDDGIVEGYVRPIINNLSVIDLQEGSIPEVIWESIVGFVAAIFTNPPEDQFATEVPLSGDLNDPDAAVFPALWNLFRNAFIEALSREVEGEIEIENTGE